MNTRSIEILYEDSHVLVCIKPHGVPTQSRQASVPDMESLAKNHICQSAPGKGEPYLAVIHRLDQPVRGILVFAKTPFAAKELNRQLQSQGFGKYYRALTDGHPPKKEGMLEDYLVKDGRTNTSRVCSSTSAGAKLARLHYTVVEQGPFLFDASQGEDGNRTELDIRLDTGRHHQIRVQLSHMGCPIAGDTKYNPDARKAGGWQDIRLCAYRLEFTHPKTRRAMTFDLLDQIRCR